MAIQENGRARSGDVVWLCKCDCGNEINVPASSLKTGNTKSCGCYRVDIACKRFTKHGMKHTPIYTVWCLMIQRCTDPNATNYKNYGGRGITVCEEWKDFSKFYEDMGDIPPGMTLDRKDNDGNYCKENCRWASYLTQENNKRNNIVITFHGQTKTLSQWARSSGINYHTLYSRYIKGLPLSLIFKSKEVAK